MSSIYFLRFIMTKNRHKIASYSLLLILSILNLSTSKATITRDSHGTVLIEHNSGRKVTTIRTLYGNFPIKHNSKDAVILDIINHPMFQRLKTVHQYGVTHFVRTKAIYIRPHNDYTRFEHSVGAMVISRKFNRPLEEQIATLLHDIKHTAFSHVGDLLFQKEGANLPYHDRDLKNFMLKHDFDEIFTQYKIKIDDILPETIGKISLKKPTNMLCTDRIEYTLQGAFKLGLLQQEEIIDILSSLKFNNEQQLWYFTSPLTASKFGYISLKITKKNSGAAWNPIIYKLMARILTQALEKENPVFEKHRIKHSLSDNEIWSMLTNCKDEFIEKSMHWLEQHENLYTIARPDASPSHVISKVNIPVFRAIDPDILDGNEIKPLSSIDDEFGTYFNDLKRLMVYDGWSIEFTIPVSVQQFYGC